MLPARTESACDAGERTTVELALEIGTRSTVTLANPATPPAIAVITAEPVDTPVTTPELEPTCATP